MFSLRRFAAIARKETLHVLRDWRSLFLALAIPMFLIILFGYALDLDVDNVPTVVWDQSRSQESRDLLAVFAGSPYFTLTRFSDGYDAVIEELNWGTAMVGLVIPADFAERVRRDQDVSVQVLIEGSDATTARMALSYAEALGMLYNRSLVIKQAKSKGMGRIRVPVELEPRVWYNLDLRSQNVIIPGIIAIVMVVIAAMLTSVTVAREWELGTMEQLISTPVRPPEIVLGKVVPYFVIGMADVLIAVVMSIYVFGVPFRGNAALLFGVASIFLVGALFFGLLLSINLKQTILANQAALLGSYLPTLLLSGYVFPLDNMPQALRAISYAVPARYFIAVLRGIYLKGIGLEILWLNVALLTLYALIMVVAANRRMKLRLE